MLVAGCTLLGMLCGIIGALFSRSVHFVTEFRMEHMWIVWLLPVAGLLLVSGIDHSVNANTIGGQGFTAIMVSWLGQFNPYIIALMSALVTFLKMGIGKVAEASFLDKSFADVASGIVILLLVSCEFFIRYSVKFRHTKAKKEGTEQ